MQRLFGRLVLVVAVALGLWFVVSHYPGGGGRFGCQAGAAVAHAEGGDCPTSASEAAGNARWAAARLATIAGDSITTGLLYDEDGHEEKIETGESGHAFDLAVQYLQPYPSTVVRGQPKGKQAAGHVEGKAAALLRNAGQVHGILVINNPTGPCPYASGAGCALIMQLILPKGSTIVVWWPGGRGTYEGTAQP